MIIDILITITNVVPIHICESLLVFLRPKGQRTDARLFPVTVAHAVTGIFLLNYGSVVQMVRTLACHARGRGFETHPSRHKSKLKKVRTKGIGITLPETSCLHRTCLVVFGQYMLALCHFPIFNTAR